MARSLDGASLFQRLSTPARRSTSAAAFCCVVLLSGNAFAAEPLFDELRFGTSVSINGGNSREPGIFPSATVFFDPLSSKGAVDWRAAILSPRLYLGALVGTGGGTDQLYGGFNWNVDLGQTFFVEVGLGGTVHDGDLDSGDGTKLGCRLLFREYAAAGYRLDNHWQLLATIDHSSHAKLCDGPNTGLTHAGLALGYKF